MTMEIQFYFGQAISSYEIETTGVSDSPYNANPTA